MTTEILTVFIILGGAILLFITELVGVDIVALLVLVSLAITGLVTPEQALSGFSNPAVVTVWAVLMLSGALSKTGIANLIGRQILRFVGKREGSLLAVIMFTSAILSGFMNSIGVASLFLPVVIDIAKNTNRSRSKLLIPLSFSALLGGLVTLIGTPPNLLISQALADAGLEPFRMFDFTPIGSIVMIAGVFFILIFGNRLLPTRENPQEINAGIGDKVRDVFELQEGMVSISVQESSPMVGKNLVESRLGLAMGLNVFAILREDERLLSPGPETVLQANDRLLVEGNIAQLEEALQSDHLILEDEKLPIEALSSTDIWLAELEITPDSQLVDNTLSQLDFRRKFGVIVIAVRQDDDVIRTDLENHTLCPGDILLIQGSQEQIDNLAKTGFKIRLQPTTEQIYNLETDLMMVRLAQDSYLVGKTLTESRLGDAFGIGVLGIIRDHDLQLMPSPDQELCANDLLLIKGKKEDLATISGLHKLQLEESDVPSIDALESEHIGLVEAIVSPYATLVGKTLNELHFRTKYGLNVLAIWRNGRSYRVNLREMALRFGDALLLYGPRENAQVLASDTDFIVLTEEAQEPLRLKKAPYAFLIMLAVLASVIFGGLNIAVAAISGVVMMVLTGSVTMEEAYRSIQWKAIFLIAGMLPLGTAMQNSGAAQFLADGMLNLIGQYGGLAVMAGLFILSVVGSQVMPNPAVAVLLAPIALSSAAELGISPYPLMMTVAISASAAFLSPVGHPANVLVMGPGGYRFKDYLIIGLPLTLVIFLVVMVVMPILWSF